MDQSHIQIIARNVKSEDFMDFVQGGVRKVFGSLGEHRPMVIASGPKGTDLVVGVSLAGLNKNQWAEGIQNMLRDGLAEKICLISEVWMKTFEKENEECRDIMENGKSLEECEGRTEAIMINEYEGDREVMWMAPIERDDNGAVLGEWQNYSEKFDNGKMEGRFSDLQKKATAHERN